MKRNFKMIALSLVLMLLLPFMVSAQDNLFKQGDMVVNAGIGLGAIYGNYWGTGYTSTMPPIFVSGDYCLREDLGPGNLGVGGLIAFSSYKYEYFGWGYKYNTFFIGVRGTYHFTDLVANLDLYGAVTIGGKIVKGKEYGDNVGYNYNTNGSSGLFELAGGARYAFTENIGVMAELGYGVAWLKLGVAFKF